MGIIGTKWIVKWNDYDEAKEFLGAVYELRKPEDGPDGRKGYSEEEIADIIGVTPMILRKMISGANKCCRKESKKEAERLKEAGMAICEIAEFMKKNESTIRLLLNDEIQIE